MMRYVLAGVSLAVVALLATAAFAINIQVSNAGTDTASCGTGANPACKTIGFGINTRAAANDTVNVADGTYNTANSEAFPISLKDNVSVIGNNAMPQNVTVDAGGTGDVFSSSGSLSGSTTISGMTIMPGGTATFNTGILFTSVSTGDTVAAVIEHNRFVGGGTGIQANLTLLGAFGTADLSPTIRNNFFSGQNDDAIHFLATDDGTGQMMAPVITNNMFVGVQDGIHVDATSEVEGMIAPMVASNTITNPTLDGVRIHATELSDNADADLTFSPMITSNVVTGPGDDGIQVAVTSVTETQTSAQITFNPTIKNNTVAGASGDEGIIVSITDFSDSVTSLSLSADITISGNMVSGMDGDGIDISITDLSDMTSGKATIKATVSGNTVTGVLQSGIELEAVDIDSSVASFAFSPTVTNNTVSGNMNPFSGIDVRYTDTGAGGTALISNNVATDNLGAGVFIDIANTGSTVPARVALRNNTITGNAGSAVLIGHTTTTFDTVLQTFVTILAAAGGNYEVDLGGGFMGGNGNNVITIAGLGDGGAAGNPLSQFDIDNNGPEDVAAVCNQFTADNAADEEPFLNDEDDDVSRGDVDPISFCTVIPVITDGAVLGSEKVTGMALPDIPDGDLEIWSTGGDGEKGTGDDELLGTGGTDSNGMFMVMLNRPLRNGEGIFVMDNANDRMSDIVLILGGVMAPALSLPMLGLVILLLFWVGGVRLRSRAA